MSGQDDQLATMQGGRAVELSVAACVAAADALDEDLPCFAVTLRSIGGDDFEISDLQSPMTLSVLFSKVATHTGWESHEVKLCLDSQVLTFADISKSLEEVGVSEGCELMCVRRSLLKLLDPGESRYNKNYFCTVSLVEEVGWRELRIHFKVVGNMSMGRLQDPAHSQLRDSGSPGSKTFICVPVSTAYVKDDRESCVEGTLTYSCVPMDEPSLTFTFGSGGYRPLSLPLNLEQS